MILYFDANVFIRAVEGADPSRTAVIELLNLSRTAGPNTICTSWLTLAELLVKPFQKLRLDRNDQEARRLISIYSALLDNRIAASDENQFSIVRAIEIDHGVLWNAAEVRALSSGLKLPDAIHLGTALTIGSEVFVSDDRRLLAAAKADMLTCSLDPADLDALLARIAAS